MGTPGRKKERDGTSGTGHKVRGGGGRGGKGGTGEQTSVDEEKLRRGPETKEDTKIRGS